MNIKFYSPQLEYLGDVENQRSLIWTRRYYESGEFNLVMPITPDNVALSKRGNIVWMTGAKDAGLIENVELAEQNGDALLTVSGRFLTAYLDRRVIKGTPYTFSGTAEDGMRAIVSNMTPIPNVVLGTRQGYTQTVEFQATYKNVLTYEAKLGQKAGLGFRMRPDFVNKQLIFEVYEGLDRSAAQDDRSRVIFSERYDNLTGAVYQENEQLYKNVAYVGGEGEASARTYVTVGDTEATGLERYEAFFNGGTVEHPEDMTEATYLAHLRTYGLQRLEECGLAASLTCSTEADLNFRYLTDYDVGDIVTVRKQSWGMETDLRITQIDEVYENGARRITPTLGTSLPLTVDLSDTY